MHSKKLLIGGLIILAISFVSYYFVMQSGLAAGGQLTDKATPPELPILMYHHLSEKPSLWNSIIVSPKKFKEDMLYLKVMGYNTIHFKDYLDYVNNRKELPDNPIIITLDDGYKSNYTHAYPILKKLNMKAMISVIGNLVGVEGGTPLAYSHFDWEEAREMYNSGVIDIQPHSFALHHPGDATHGKGVLPRPGEDQESHERRFRQDTVRIKKLIESNVGNEVIVYTYPYGVYNNTTEKILKDLGFKFTLTVNHGLADLSNGYTLNRINVPADMSSAELVRLLLKLQGKKAKIPFENIADQDERIAKLTELVQKGQ
ncbi:MAG: polysaccharide deacetylase family protein [Thermoanaerobacteraceae bacterium]|nr:polysaccharide deacetylase family protein [Thermoanaerobacteraceae bacterium]